MSTAIKSKPTSKPKPAAGISVKSGPALMHWRRERGLSRPLFADIADCSERTLATYESKAKLPAKFVRPVTEAMRLVSALREIAGDDDALKDWLQKPNPAFAKKTPLSLIKTGQADVLWEMVYQIRQGAFA